MKRPSMDNFILLVLPPAFLISLMNSYGFEKTGPLPPDRQATDLVRIADGSSPTAQEILATVNGEAITRGEVELRIAQFATMNSKAEEAIDEKQQALMRQMLNRLIEERLLLQQAVQEGIQVSDEEAGRFLAELRQQFSSDEEMDAFLKKGKTSIALRKKSDKDFMMTRKLEDKVVEQIVITKDEIKDYWERTKPFLLRDTVKARHILVKTEDEAQEILKKLKKGERFEALARQRSQDPGTKERGGDLGWFSKEMMIKEFGEAAFALKVGEISPPVKTRFGYHLILVEGKKSKEEQTLEDHREHVRHTLRQERWLKSQRAEWVASLKTKAKIWNKLASAPLK